MTPVTFLISPIRSRSGRRSGLLFLPGIREQLAYWQGVLYLGNVLGTTGQMFAASRTCLQG